MKEKDLDKLFQEAAKKATVGNQDEGWAAMEAKLKGAGMVTGTKPKSWFHLNTILIILLLLIGGGAGIFWYASSVQTESNSQISSNTEDALENKAIAEHENASKSASEEQEISNNEAFDQSSLEKDTQEENDNLISEAVGISTISSETDLLNSNDNSLERSEVEGEESSTTSSIPASRDLLSNGSRAQDTNLHAREEVILPRLTDEANTGSNSGANDVDSEQRLDYDMEANGDSKADLSLTKTKQNRIVTEDIPYKATKNKASERVEDNEVILPSGHIEFTDEKATEHRKLDSMFFAGPALILPLSISFHPEINWSAPEIKPYEIREMAIQNRSNQDTIVKRSRWSIGLEFSPELSTVRLGEADDLGYTVGLHGEYHLSSKWSVFGGLSYSKKIYVANDGIESYPGTNPNWTLERVEANCDVIDIPINVSYYSNGYEESGFVFGAGFSTYFMLTENYDIIYDDPWPEGTQFFRNDNQHFLGILNASVGYRKRLNSVLSLQAEPYLKIPIQGIGAGRLDLYTSGLRLILKYNHVYSHK